MCIYSSILLYKPIFVCTCTGCAHSYIAVDPLPSGEISRVAFKYWDELTETCGDISKAAGCRGVARF